MWNKEGFAKSAFTNYIKCSFTRKNIVEMGFVNGKEPSNYLLNTGIVKIEKLWQRKEGSFIIIIKEIIKWQYTLWVLVT